jgi:tetratricopeptide (TPR) repeat protein
MGRAHVRQGNPAAGEEILREAVRQDPTLLEAQLSLFESLLGQRKLPEALAEARKTAGNFPNSSAALLSLARCYEVARQFTNAIPIAQNAVRVEPDNAEARLRLASDLFRSGRFVEAVTAGREALRLSPSDPEVHMLVGCSLGMASVADRREVSAFTPDFQRVPDGSVTSSEQLAKNGLAHLETALALAPEFADAWNHLAWILATHPETAVRDGKRAAACAERACALQKTPSADMLRTLAAARAEARDFSGALEALAQAEKAAVGDRTASQSWLDQMKKLFEAGEAFRQLRASETGR